MSNPTLCPHCGADFQRDGIYAWTDAEILDCYYPETGDYDRQETFKQGQPYRWSCPECDTDIDYRGGPAS